MDLDEYQRAALTTRRPRAKTDDRDPRDPMVSLLGLAGEAGQLLSEYKKYLRDGDAYRPFPQRVCEELGDLLWYVASAGNDFGLTLEEIAAANLRKCTERFGSAAGTSRRFDEGFPELEQFPRTLQVKLVSVHEAGRTKLRMLFEDGRPLGDDLTDNAYEADGYRFHDVFHLACMATLGWSPVMRKLLNRKRRSDPQVNEIEDGGRATAIEEGISALVFSYASERSHLDGIANVDYDLLRTIKGMTHHLEVGACPARDWERTIFTTYEVWREVERLQHGILKLDLNARTLALVG